MSNNEPHDDDGFPVAFPAPPDSGWRWLSSVSGAWKKTIVTGEFAVALACLIAGRHAMPNVAMSSDAILDDFANALAIRFSFAEILYLQVNADRFLTSFRPDCIVRKVQYISEIMRISDYGGRDTLSHASRAGS